MTTEPFTIAQDWDGYWHSMFMIAHRRRSFCGWLDVDCSSIDRGDTPAKKITNADEITCDGCRAAALAALADAERRAEA